MEKTSINLDNFVHDINNFIAVIKLYSQLGLRDPAVGEPLKESLNIILDQAAKAILLIETMKKAMTEESTAVSDSRVNHINENKRGNSEETLQVLLDNLPGFAFRCINAPGWPMYCISEGFYELTGYQLEEVMSDNYFEFEKIIHKDDRRYVDETVQECVINGLPFTLEYRIITKMNVEKRVWAKGRQIPGINNAEFHLEGFIMDVSDRVQVEEALILSEEKYSKVFKTSQLAILITRVSDGLILDVNPGFEKILGYSREESLGKTLFQLRHWVNLSDRDQLVSDLEHQVVVNNREYIYQHKTGEIRTGLYNAELITIRDIPCILASVSDITELKKNEAERKKMEEQLIHAQKIEVIGKLAGGIAHEFNNTLQVINSLTELSLIKLDPENPIVVHLEQIRNSVKQSSGFVGQLLAFARKQPVNPEAFNLNDFIKGNHQILQRLITEQIKLQYKLSKSLGKVLLDPLQVNQILINLVLNARDAIENKGEITISTSNETISDQLAVGNQAARPGKYVMLELTDNGCGMDESTLSRIFEPFYTTKPKGKGTGLGLSTIYGIVKQNSGFIQVKSKPGEGTTFKIYFPRN